MMRLFEREYIGGLRPRAVYEIHEGTSADTLELDGFVEIQMIGSGTLNGKCSVFDRAGVLIGARPVDVPDGSAESLRLVALAALRHGLPQDEDIA
jgi:hypothetical protein